MVNVAKLLQARGFHVTFVNSEYNHARLVRTRGAAAVAGSRGFRFATIPDGLLAASDDDVTQDIPSLCKSTTETCLGPFRRLLAQLNAAASTGDHPPVTCVISDLIMGFSMDAAKELGLPYVQLWTASAISYLAYYHSGTELPYKDWYVKQLTDGYLDTPVEDLPGLWNMRLRDFPSFIRSTDPDEFMVGYVIKETGRAAGASAVILNSFGDLEGEAVEAMEALLVKVKVYTLGPLNLVAPRETSSIGRLSPWKEQEECLEWLHGKEPASVVYVNFGSIVVMTSVQLVEFAWGLANSGRQFMWIIRPDLVRGDAAVLPQEFLAETAGRGLMASWCPQQEVLNHPAVGVVLSPDSQRVELGAGERIDTNVQRDAVTSLIAELMDGEGGKKMRKRAQQWREKAIMAAKPHGPSHRNFDELVRNVLLAKT
ncbi:hypothetical protein ACQ4PT_046142 [Festuca glaucescens]